MNHEQPPFDENELARALIEGALSDVWRVEEDFVRTETTLDDDRIRIRLRIEESLEEFGNTLSTVVNGRVLGTEDLFGIHLSDEVKEQRPDDYNWFYQIKSLVSITDRLAVIVSVRDMGGPAEDIYDMLAETEALVSEDDFLDEETKTAIYIFIGREFPNEDTAL